MHNRRRLLKSEMSLSKEHSATHSARAKAHSRPSNLKHGTEGGHTNSKDTSSKTCDHCWSKTSSGCRSGGGRSGTAGSGTGWSSRGRAGSRRGCDSWSIVCDWDGTTVGLLVCQTSSLSSSALFACVTDLEQCVAEEVWHRWNVVFETRF